MAGHRGRPNKGDDAKRSVIAVRTTKETKERITQAAVHADRSLTQEIEQRLEWSLRFEDELGGPEGIRLFKAMAQVMALAAEKVGHWQSDFAAYSSARDAVLQVMDAYAPPYPPDMAKLLSEAIDFRESSKADKLSLLKQLTEKLGDFSRLAPKNLGPTTEGLMAGIHYRPIVDDDLTDSQLEEEISHASLDTADAELLRKYHQAKRRERIAIKVIEDEAAKLKQLEAAARRRTSGLIRKWIEGIQD